MKENNPNNIIAPLATVLNLFIAPLTTRQQLYEVKKAADGDVCAVGN
jgi:hypothetical protein